MHTREAGAHCGADLCGIAETKMCRDVTARGRLQGRRVCSISAGQWAFNYGGDGPLAAKLNIQGMRNIVEQPEF